ncbi:MAG: hypothetical protein ACOCQ1_00300 [Halanaerobiaceae bacterium]
MQKKMFFSVLIGSIAYMLVVLYGLILRYSLIWILRKSLLALIISFVTGLFFTNIPSILKMIFGEVGNNEKKKKEDQNLTQEEIEHYSQQNENSEQSEENFSPLDPPELEVKDE